MKVIFTGLAWGLPPPPSPSPLLLPPPPSSFPSPPTGWWYEVLELVLVWVGKQLEWLIDMHVSIHHHCSCSCLFVKIFQEFDQCSGWASCVVIWNGTVTWYSHMIHILQIGKFSPLKYFHEFTGETKMKRAKIKYMYTCYIAEPASDKIF